MRALDVGCGMMGWLRLLAEWVGPQGSVVGTDIDEKMLSLAESFVAAESLANVSLVRDDLFASALPKNSFDLVHARFQIAPLGRAEEQVTSYLRLVKRGGWIVLEDPEIGSWRVNPEAQSVHDLISLIEESFRSSGGDFNAGRYLPSLLRAHEIEPFVEARVIALAPGHAYLRLPLQFATSLRPRLISMVGDRALGELISRAEEELSTPDVWGTTFTLIQAFGILP